MGQSFSSFLREGRRSLPTRGCGRYSRQASLLIHSRTSSLLTSDVISPAALRTVSISRHTDSLKCRHAGSFNAAKRTVLIGVTDEAEKYCASLSFFGSTVRRRPMAGVKAPHTSASRRAFTAPLCQSLAILQDPKLRADGWRHGSTYAPFSLSGSRWTMTWVAGPKACLIFCSMAVAWRWAS